MDYLMKSSQLVCGTIMDDYDSYQALNKSRRDSFPGNPPASSLLHLPSSSNLLGVNYMDYLMKSSQLVCGTIMDDYDYAALTSIQQMSEYGETEITLMSPEVFYPQTLAAIITFIFIFPFISLTPFQLRTHSSALLLRHIQEYFFLNLRSISNDQRNDSIYRNR